MRSVFTRVPEEDAQIAWQKQVIGEEFRELVGKRYFRFAGRKGILNAEELEAMLERRREREGKKKKFEERIF